MKRLMMVALAFLVMLPVWVMATGEAETAAPEGPLTVTALAPFSGTNKPEVYPYWAELANEKFNLEIDFERTSRDGIDEKINLRFAAGDYFDWLDATNANPPESAIKRWGLEGHLVALDDLARQSAQLRGPMVRPASGQADRRRVPPATWSWHWPTRAPRTASCTTCRW